MWSRAAIAAIVLKRFGEDGIADLVRASGWSRSSVYQLAKVFKAFPPASRRLDVSFHLYVEALKAKEPAKAIEVAERESLTVREAREAFRVHRDDPEAVTKESARALVEAAAQRQASPVPAPAPRLQESAAPPAPLDLKALAREVARQRTRAEITQFCTWLAHLVAADEQTPEEA